MSLCGGDVVRLVEAETRAVAFDTEASLEVLGEGWDGAHGDVFWQEGKWAWASRHTAEMWLTVLAPRDLELCMELFPRPFPALPPQRCEFIWGSERLGSLEFRKEDGFGARRVQLHVPASCQSVGPNRLIVSSLYAASPAAFEGEGDDPRSAAVALKALEIREIGGGGVAPSIRVEEGQVTQNRYVRWRVPVEIPAEGSAVIETRLKGRARVLVRQDTLGGAEESVVFDTQSDGLEKLVADLSPWNGRRVEIVFESAAADGELVTWVEPTLVASGAVTFSEVQGEPMARPVLPPRKARHVVLVVLDALRADALGCYGYHRDTSPFLDSVAERGVVFDSARSAYTYTYPSVTSLLTSLHAFQHGVEDRYHDRLQDDTVLLQHWLQSQGVGTGCVSQNPFLSEGRGLGRCFGLFRGFFGEEFQSSEGCAGVTAAAIDIARELQKAPSFTYVHYLPPHAPYEMAGEFAHLFSSVPREDVDTRACWAKSVLSGAGVTSRQMAKIRAAYDENVRKADSLLRDLFEGLRQAGFGEETAVIVTSDHGEEFMEHGEAEHGGTPFETQCRVPLIVTTVSEEGLGSGMRCGTRVGTVDLAPTICELLGVSCQPHAVGRSVLGASSVIGDPSFCQGPPQLSREADKRREAYVWDRYKLLTALPKAGEPFGEASRWASVYDLGRDPDERHDLAPLMPVLANHLQSRAAVWRARQGAAFSPSDLKGGGASPVTEDPAVEEALEALGYLSAG